MNRILKSPYWYLALIPILVGIGLEAAISLYGFGRAEIAGKVENHFIPSVLSLFRGDTFRLDVVLPFVVCLRCGVGTI